MENGKRYECAKKNKKSNVIIMGGSHGIGRALVKAFLNGCCHVCGCSSNKNDPRGAQMEAAYSKYHHYTVDISNEMQVKEFVENYIQKYGKIDIVIVCAGIGYKKRPVDQMRKQEVCRVFEVNLMGAANTMKYALPYMQETGGTIAVCGSIAFDTAGTGADWAYGASKAALIPLLKETAADPRFSKVRFVYFKLGYVKTRMTAMDDPRKWLEETPYAKAATPEEMAEYIRETVEDPSFSHYIEKTRIGGNYPQKTEKKIPGRRAGILLPVFSLPNEYGCGSFGQEAYEFLDLLERAGLRYWMMLPLNQTGYADSPYSPITAMGGSMYYISVEKLKENGWISEKTCKKIKETENFNIVDYEKCYLTRREALKEAYQCFLQECERKDLNKDFVRFCSENEEWLDDYAVYMEMKTLEGGKEWGKWENAGWRMHEEESILRFKEEHRFEISFWKFVQYVFYAQFDELRAYANQKDIQLVGDISFYVESDSADVWTHRELFCVTYENGNIIEFGGVPGGDGSFKEDRRWGSPTYKWQEHKKDGFAWWRSRIRCCAKHFDGIRIDHAIGLERYYGIPDSFKKGTWKKGPGKKIFEAIQNEAGRYGTWIIAEDLGDIPPGFRERMKEFGWIGMRVLQFGYVGKYHADNNHLPMHHTADMMVFTGTHDNPTLKQYIRTKTEDELRYMKYQLNVEDRDSLHWALIKAAFQSPADLCTVPAQDYLELDEDGKMVYQEKYTLSWRWRMKSLDVFTPELISKIRMLTILNGRCQAKEEAFREALLQTEKTEVLKCQEKNV